MRHWKLSYRWENQVLRTRKQNVVYDVQRVAEIYGIVNFFMLYNI